MKLRLLCVFGLLATSTTSFAGGDHGEHGEQNNSAAAHQEAMASNGHKALSECTRKGIQMLMELDKFLVIPTEDEEEVIKFLKSSDVINAATEKERELFLTLAAKKNIDGMSAAKVKKLFAESIVEKCK